MLVKKIDAFHPNGAQTVPNDLTAVTVKLAGACNCHCANKCHSVHVKYFGRPRSMLNKTRGSNRRLISAAVA